MRWQHDFSSSDGKLRQNRGLRTPRGLRQPDLVRNGELRCQAAAFAHPLNFQLHAFNRLDYAESGVRSLPGLSIIQITVRLGGINGGF